MFKRGVSPVIATVLLLALTVGLASIIFAFVIPFVQDQLGNSKACLKVLDGVEFADSKFNCYSSSETGFSIKVKKAEVTAVKVSFINDVGNSEVKNIPDNEVDTRFKIIEGDYGPALNNFPTSGGQRTYVINDKYSKAEVSPVTESGNVCAVADVIEFTPCSPDVVFS